MVIDFGCGNALWNADGKFCVMGVDKNMATLKYAHNKKRIHYVHVLDIEKDEPTIPNNAKVIIATEVIEHLRNYREFLLSIRGQVGKTTKLIISVPFDTWTGLWKPLFALQCFLQGTVLKDPYYQQRCGHINHWNKRTMTEELQALGFRVLEVKIYMRMTMFVVLEKEE